MRRSKSRPQSLGAVPRKGAAFTPLIVSRQRRYPVRTQDILSLLQKAATFLGARGELTVVFGADALLRRLNREFRFKDKPTDVLSFRNEDKDLGLGDVIVSVETARGNAALYSRTLDRELEILVLHGLLHVLGYDHETDRGEMEALEKRLRARFLTRKRPDTALRPLRSRAEGRAS